MKSMQDTLFTKKEQNYKSGNGRYNPPKTDRNRKSKKRKGKTKWNLKEN